MQECTLMSVPHSGTNLMLNILWQAGYKPVGVNTTVTGEPQVHQGHMTSLAQVQHALRLNLPIIVPLRHPYRVEASWRARNKDLAEGFFMAWYYCAYRIMHSGEFMLMPVDVPNRDDWLRAVSERLGVELTTDWPLVRSVGGTHDLPLDQCSPSEAVQNMTAELYWLDDIYGGDE